MADFSALKTAIQTYIKQNGNEEITGAILQEILLSVATTLGDSAINDLVTALANEVAARQNADGTLQQNINSEAAARNNADTALGGRIDDEATARANGDTALSNRLGSSITAENTAADQIGAEAEAREAADTALQGLIDGITDNIENGYVYAGIATPSSTPATGKVFYLALTAGTYTHFGSTEVSQGINILKYNGSAWSLDAFIGIDDELTAGSNNLPKSGNVLENIIKNGSAFDLSAYNAVDGVLATYADLDAALTALNALPAVYKQGGMSFKFVQSSDNNYVKFFCMAQNFTTDTTQWQGVDNEPVAGSENLVKSGGVALKEHYLDEIEPVLNLLNTDTRSEDGVWCNYLNGKYQRNSSVTDFSYYAPCLVKGNTTYARILDCGGFGTVFFDKNMVYISGVTTDVFTTPANAVYAVLNTTNYVTANQVLIERDSAYNPTTEGALHYKTKLKHGDYVSTSDFNTAIANKADKQDFDTFVYDLTGEKQYPVKNGGNTWVALDIKAGQKYSVKNNTSGYIAMGTYSQDKQTAIESLAGALAGQTYTFVASADAYYLLMYGSAAGTADITDYSFFIPKTKSDINSLNTAVAENNVKALITTGDNVFNNQWGELGRWCNYTNGRFESTQYVTNYKCSDYIEVLPSTDYSRLKDRGQFSSVFFDANKTFISGVQTDTFTTPSNCKYVVINITSDVGFYDVVVKGTHTILNRNEYPYYNRFVYEQPDFLLKIGIGTDYPSIKDGFARARSLGCGVEIVAGEYDLVQEGISGIGYLLPRKVVGYGAILKCHLSSEDWNLSPVNVNYNSYGTEVYGLTIDCTNCRYCIHDEMYQMPNGYYYKNIFKDLTLIHRSAPSATLLGPNNIGGGLGYAGEVYVENCIMTAAGNVNSDYHSRSGGQEASCKVFFKDCVMNKTITATSIGSETSYKNKVYVTNCLCGTIPVDSDDNNMQLIAWNNVANN